MRYIRRSSRTPLGFAPLICNGTPSGADHRRVMLLSVGAVYGGAESYYIKLAKLLQGRYELTAIVGNPRQYDELVALGIRTIGIGGGQINSSICRYCQIASRMIKAIRECRPHVIHMNGQAETHLTLLANAQGITTVSTRHTAFDSNIPAHKRVVVAQNLKRIAKTICVSSVLKDQLSRVVDERRLVVIPNWIEPLPERRVYCPPDTGAKLRLLYVGRLIRPKGIFDLIAAVRHLENISLEVVGDGPELERATEYSRGLPVQFHGFQLDCSRFYRNADLLVFPSHPCLEGHPQVPIEAMAHGLPALISNIAVNLDTADGGAAAELYQWGSIGDLVMKLMALQSNPARLRELSQRGFDHVRRCYTTANAKENYFRVFDETVSQTAY